MKKLLSSVALVAGIAATGLSHAATGGGATIHNAATLNFNGGQVTASVNVEVLTIGAAPTFASTPETSYAGNSTTVTYTVTSNSNGSDTYDLAVSTNDTDVGAPSNLTITPPSVTLGASITSQPSTPNTVYIPAGSEDNLSAGDTVRINLGGTDYFYTVGAVTVGTPASTSGNTTTAEVPSSLTLTAQGAAPAIGNGNIPLGTQIGEVKTITVTLDAGTPTTPGTDGTHDIVIDGTAGAPGPAGPGDVVDFTDIGTGTITVMSGDATLDKQVRNLTQGGAFASTGVSGRSGDVLEYRLRANTIPGQTVTGAVLTDSIPDYSTYVPNSTLLNGAAVADVAGTSPLVGGLSVNSATGAAGEIVDGEVAEVIFQVTIQ